MTAPNPSLENNPRPDRWLTIAPDGRILVRSGKVELGQGVLTALAQIAAEELDVDPGRIVMVPAATDRSPDEAYTAGSLSIQHSGTALRAVCARARALHLAHAAEGWGIPAEGLTVDDGAILAPDGRWTTYWEQSSAVPLDADAAPAAPKPAAEHRVVGRSMPRLDIPDKVAGRARFIQDLAPPGMLHGRVLRPPSRGAVLADVDDRRAREVPGVVAVVRDGSFLGVVAEREENALRALAALHCAWSERDTLPDERQLPAFLVAAPAEETVLEEQRPAAPSGSSRQVRARFSRPYLAHASIAPSCGLALWEDGRLSVWTHSQGVFKLRTEICRSLGLAADDVVVHHVEGAGCYGHNPADDAAYDAVLLARAVPGRTVRVLWSREDELSCGPFGPAMVVDIAVDLDAIGQVCCWQHDVWSNGHSGRPASPGSPPLLAATHVADALPEIASSDPPLKNGGGSGRNAVPLYELPGQVVRTHRLQTMPLRTSALRALGAHLNVYAIESVVDELAELAGVDPVEYRLRLLRDERAAAVLLAATERAGWPGSSGEGLGVGLARYKNRGAWCAVVAEVEAETSVRVRRLTIAVDVGQVVNPDGVVNQIEGGALQAVSWTTKERVRFDARGVTSRTWEEYPILTFSEAPAVDVVIVDRPDQPPLGAGEASIGPTAAAIGNALYAATGLRVRDLPLTPENVIAAMEPDSS